MAKIYRNGIEIGGTSGGGSADLSTIVSEYDSTKTYALNDIVMHDGSCYHCSTAISSAESWTAVHWTACTLADLITDQMNIPVVNNVGY